MIRATTFLTLLVPAACASAAPPPKAEPAFDEDRCDRAAAAVLIGRKATLATGEQARKLAGAALVRIIRAGDPVTSDYQTSRINVDVGRDGRVADVRCG